MKNKSFTIFLACVITAIACLVGVTLVRCDELKAEQTKPVNELSVHEQDGFIYIGDKKDAQISTSENYYTTYLWTYENGETSYEKQMICNGGYIRFGIDDDSIILYDCIDSDGTTGAQFPDKLTIERAIDDGYVRYYYCSREWTFDKEYCGGIILIFHQLSPKLYVLRGATYITDGWSVCYSLSVNRAQI